MTADYTMINANLQSRNTKINKVKEYKKITVSLSRSSWLNNRDQYTQLTQIKKKDRQKCLLTLLNQRLSERDKNQLLKKERYFKCHKFKHLMMNCIIKKQNISNVAEKNNTESVTKRRQIKKRCRSSFVNNTDDSKN